MKHSKLVATAAIFAGSLAAHAYAANTKPGSAHEIKMMDTNADGKIAPDEHAAAPRRCSRPWTRTRMARSRRPR
jgi:hypothetical protein